MAVADGLSRQAQQAGGIVNNDKNIGVYAIF